MQELFNVISKLNTTKEVESFLMDLCTPAELKSFAERWKVCRLLHEGKLSYRQIKEITGASLTTIGRVARFLNDENYGGYRSILKRFEDSGKNGSDGNSGVSKISEM